MAEKQANSKLISLKDAAFKLNISYREAYDLAFNGRIGYERLPDGKLMLRRSDVERYKQSAPDKTETAPEMPHFAPPASGNILQGRYKIIETIKEGGYGTVYKAKHLKLDKFVALKKEKADDPAFRKSLENEAKLLANLNLRHPNLPAVTDAFTERDNSVYLVMDYVDGTDLQRWVSKKGAVPEDTVVSWAETLLDVLHFLHSQNPPVIHRDIKPSNIILQSSNHQLYLVDFGIAKNSERTVVGGRSPFFASPEHDGGGTDSRSDIYSLGATLYFLLAAVNPTDVKKRLYGEPLAPLSEYHASQNVSEELWQVIKKAMALNPAERWQSASEMRRALPNTATQKTQ